MSGFVGNAYSEDYFHNFEVLAGTARLFRTQLFGQNGTSLFPIATDTNGQLVTTTPGDSFTLGYTGSNLTTVTRASDSKTITLGYTGSNLTSVSDWT